ncbi:circadian locomoter output cycles protein kaput-like [Lineus longissimus]|uniref:circadian locomoter output cycles protein kaput-like n=1 Tax=Lineus longissimus TaxID=88925 RepID=UPI002B4D32BA
MAAKVRELLKTNRLKVEVEKGTCFKSGVMKKPSRKECEKMRRDRLNNFIGELAEMVPLVKNAKKRLNKTGILRLTVNYLRLHQDLQRRNHSDSKPWRPAYIESNFPIEFLESNNSFLFVYNKKGILTYISENVSSLLGQNQIDLLGQSILKIVHSDYQNVFLDQLKGPKETTSFSCKMLCSCLNSPMVHYECVQVTGHVRRAGEQDIAGGFLGSVRDVYCVAVGKVMSKAVIHNLYPANSSPLDFSNSLQYVSRHYLDGSVENMDQRASVIMGYMTKDMEGGNPYFSIHPNDLVFVARAHQRVFEENVIQSTVYRYLTCENKVLHIESETHLIEDQFTRKPKLILSFNNIVSSMLGRQLIRKQREGLIKERKANRRERICAGEVSDEVDKNDDGAIVQLVYDENLVSISVPFNDFHREEMQRDDLLITDELVKEDFVKKDSAISGSVEMTASSDSDNSAVSHGLKPGLSHCDSVLSTFGEQCSPDIAGTSVGITGPSSSAEAWSPSASHFESFQGTSSAGVKTSESHMENYYRNLGNLLEDITEISSFSVGPSECSDTQFSPYSTNGVDSTQQVVTPGQDNYTLSPHQTFLPDGIDPKFCGVGDVDPSSWSGSCNLKATWPNLSDSSTALPSVRSSNTLPSLPLTCSTKAIPSHCDADSSTDQSCLDGPNQLNTPSSNYSHSVLRALLEVCDRDQPSSNSESIVTL